MMRRPAYNPEEIRDALTVADVLESTGIPVESDRIACPIHDGEDVTAFAIYDEGRRYWCHTECGKGGDVFTLIMALAEKRSGKVGFRKALELAARLAKIEPGPPPSPSAIAARKAERERRKAERAASLAIKHDESIRRATETWLDLMRPWWHDGRRRRLCGEYLATRGLGPLADTESSMHETTGRRQFRSSAASRSMTRCFRIPSSTLHGDKFGRMPNQRSSSCRTAPRRAHSARHGGLRGIARNKSCCAKG